MLSFAQHAERQLTSLGTAALEIEGIWAIVPDTACVWVLGFQAQHRVRTGMCRLRTAKDSCMMKD